MGKKLFLFISIFSVLLFFSSNGFSVEFDLGQNTTLDVATTLKWGGAWRVKGKNKKLIQNINKDDGDRNFDVGDMINNRFSIIMDTELKYKNFGIFARPRAYYDFAYTGKNANDSPFTNNNGPVYGGPLSKTDRFMSETKNLHRDKVEILDLYTYGEFSLDGHSINIRIGRQVVSWGESIFLLNSISSAQSPLDATAAHTPGTELRDIFLPVGQVYTQIDLFKNFTLQAYYQWEWEKNRLDEAGSFFSTDDYLFSAGRRFLVPVMINKGLAATIDRIGTDYAKNSGQWGIAFRYFAEGLNDTDFGFYIINYHEKMPEIVGRFSGGHLSRDWTKLVPGKTGAILNLVDGSSYQIRYGENIRLYGFSFGTEIFDINVSGEFSYRDNYPVMVKDPKNILKFSYKNASVVQAQISFIYILSQRLAVLWDDATIMGEVGINRVNGISGSKLYKDKSAWGGTVKLTPKYYNFILPNMTLSIPTTYKFNPNGVSSVLGTFKEHSDSFSIGLSFNYLEDYQFGISYTAYLGGPKRNLQADRDYIAVDFKYTF